MAFPETKCSITPLRSPASPRQGTRLPALLQSCLSAARSDAVPAVYRICSLQKPMAVAPVHAVVFLLVLLTQLFGYTVPGSALVMIVLLALANATKVVISAAGVMEGTLPLSSPLDIDNATIDRAFESAKLQLVKHLGTLRRVLRMEDIVLSVRTVAVIIIAASADWMLCIPVFTFFWIVAIGLCVADTQARDMVRWFGRAAAFRCARPASLPT